MTKSRKSYTVRLYHGGDDWIETTASTKYEALYLAGYLVRGERVSRVEVRCKQQVLFVGHRDGFLESRG